MRERKNNSYMKKYFQLTILLAGILLLFIISNIFQVKSEPQSIIATSVTPSVSEKITVTLYPTTKEIIDPYENNSPTPKVEEVDNYINTHYSIDELKQFVLNLINADRKNASLKPVFMDNKTAAQKHAEEMMNNKYISHWNLLGQKPYVRYSIENGTQAVAENVALTSYYQRDSKNLLFDAKIAIANHEYGMMYDDADWDWGHRDTILNPYHKKVNIGVAYNNETLALVQDFETDNIIWEQLPTIQNGWIKLKGKVLEGQLYDVYIYYEKFPQSLDLGSFKEWPYNGSYSEGENVAVIIEADHFLNNFNGRIIYSTRYNANAGGPFEIEAYLGDWMLDYNDGIYTVDVVGMMNDRKKKTLSTYSIFYNKTR
ncbi:MAG: CAP domain-containing protein [Candidatus Micrarchaeota archaeon]